MSVFTFDVDPPQMASPWLRPADSDTATGSGNHTEPGATVHSGSLADYGVTKLEAEPQEGPTEYKLHLLLRPRRRYEYMSTTTRVPGSIHSSRQPAPASLGPSTPTSQSRHDRLTHLTTQLLWRLQQSCPYNPSSAATDLVIPQLPDEAWESDALPRLGKVPPGLEASRGALYEIGVADDGTFVGLTKDELQESLRNLRIMACSLGCNMEVLRRVIVGHCQWMESTGDSEMMPHTPGEVKRSQAKLWVAEALITPGIRLHMGPRDVVQNKDSLPFQPPPKPAETLPDPKHKPFTRAQLRITLTGPTTSGKSSLLGTLSTGVFDNGRGKSRQNLLKHRHELASGVTSSVSQEILGYNGVDIVNYAHPDIESWIDIHDHVKDGRLVYLVDSAGHPRYRRTILRGMIGWAPHWTLFCMAADDGSTVAGPDGAASARDILGVTGAGVDLPSAHLDLCLQLKVPLVIVITKYDMASKVSIHRVLSKVFSCLKRAGRSPNMVRDTEGYFTGNEVSDLGRKDVVDALQKIAGDDLLSVVPIVLSSAVNGKGIGHLHALLQNLPIPSPPTSHDFVGEALNPEQPACLFHVEDKFSLPASYTLATTLSTQPTDFGTVVAGYLRFGTLTIGDKVLIGPYQSGDDESRGSMSDSRGGNGLSISHTSSTELTRIAQKNAISASSIKSEWHDARIVSIRNLRLPVQTLEPGQVGSIGVVFDTPDQDGTADVTASAVHSIPSLRKGMILAVPSKHMLDTGLSLQAASGLTASFQGADAASLTAGSLVNIYVASVRAAARITRISHAAHSPNEGSGIATDDIDDVPPQGVEVQLELFTNREWIELGSQILLLEGGARDRSGLEGHVGKVMEIVD